MPDDDPYNALEDGDPDDVVQLTRAQVAEMRSKARNDSAAKTRRTQKAEDEAEAERVAAIADRRELAFLKAGLSAEDLESPVGKLFARTYDGELTPEALKSAAAELGLMEPTGTATDEEKGATEERRDLAAGANAPDGTEASTVDPRDEAVNIAKTALEDGASENEALSLAFRRIHNAATDGDERTMWKQVPV